MILSVRTFRLQEIIDLSRDDGFYRSINELAKCRRRRSMDSDWLSLLITNIIKIKSIYVSISYKSCFSYLVASDLFGKYIAFAVLSGLTSIKIATHIPGKRQAEKKILSLEWKLDYMHEMNFYYITTKVSVDWTTISALFNVFEVEQKIGCRKVLPPAGDGRRHVGFLIQKIEILNHIFCCCHPVWDVNYTHWPPGCQQFTKFQSNASQSSAKLWRNNRTTIFLWNKDFLVFVVCFSFSVVAV